MIRLGWFDSRKVIELALGKMRKLMRPWLEVTNTETGGQSEQTNFALTAHTLPSLAIILIMY